MDDGTRVWRMRKLHRHIDARLRRSGAGIELELTNGERVIYRRTWPSRGEAEEDAAARRDDLARVGWTEHW